ncbi:hypothetical protein E2C01_020356 [Portunus trituberculatus]|uniref:Uncharacterized protein n=1 Tax=Portunus trituberculatus TaxID=210409 RepID=A0A5B7DZW2_PORTR|nr:hypothetical protein [Portunus trituberculatus]
MRRVFRSLVARRAEGRITVTSVTKSVQSSWSASDVFCGVGVSLPSSSSSSSSSTTAFHLRLGFITTVSSFTSSTTAFHLPLGLCSSTSSSVSSIITLHLALGFFLSSASSSSHSKLEERMCSPERVVEVVAVFHVPGREMLSSSSSTREEDWQEKNNIGGIDYGMLNNPYLRSLSSVPRRLRFSSRPTASLSFACGTLVGDLRDRLEGDLTT